MTAGGLPPGLRPDLLRSPSVSGLASAAASAVGIRNDRKLRRRVPLRRPGTKRSTEDQWRRETRCKGGSTHAADCSEREVDSFRAAQRSRCIPQLRHSATCRSALVSQPTGQRPAGETSSAAAGRQVAVDGFRSSIRSISVTLIGVALLFGAIFAGCYSVAHQLHQDRRHAQVLLKSEHEEHGEDRPPDLAGRPARSAASSPASSRGS